MKYSINKSLLLESVFSDEISDNQHDQSRHDAIMRNHQEAQESQVAHQNVDALRHALPVPREIDRAHQPAYQGVPNIGQNFLNKFNVIASKFR